MNTQSATLIRRTSVLWAVFLIAFVPLLSGQTKSPEKIDTAEKLVCRNTSLKEIAKVLSVWYDLKICIDSEASCAETYSGILYRKQGIKGINEMLVMALDVIPYYKDGVLHYRSSGKSYAQKFIRDYQ